MNNTLSDGNERVEDFSSKYDSKILNEMLYELVEKTPLSKRAYLHFRTVKNFIFYFNSLLNKQKGNVYLMLKDYLSMLNGEADLTEYSRVDAMNCFDRFLLPISEIYQDYLGFSLYPKLWIILVWIFGAVLFLFLLHASFYFYALLFLFFLGYYIKIFIQIRKKKVYGYFF